LVNFLSKKTTECLFKWQKVIKFVICLGKQPFLSNLGDPAGFLFRKGFYQHFVILLALTVLYPFATGAFAPFSKAFRS